MRETIICFHEIYAISSCILPGNEVHLLLHTLKLPFYLVVLQQSCTQKMVSCVVGVAFSIVSLLIYATYERIQTVYELHFCK